jgi:hypothetical protein
MGCAVDRFWAVRWIDSTGTPGAVWWSSLMLG